MKKHEYRGRPDDSCPTDIRHSVGTKVDRIVRTVQAPIDPNTGEPDIKYPGIVRHNVERGIKIYGV